MREKEEIFAKILEQAIDNFGEDLFLKEEQFVQFVEFLCEKYGVSPEEFWSFIDRIVYPFMQEYVIQDEKKTLGYIL